MKPLGSQSNQVPTNDQLGRFAFLNRLPPDVLKFLQSFRWKFKKGVTIETPDPVGSNQVSTTQYVQDVLNKPMLVTLIDGVTQTLSTTTLAYHTIILQGSLTAPNTVIFSQSGQWNIVNHTNQTVLLGAGTGSPATYLGPNQNAPVIVNGNTVEFVASPRANFIMYYSFPITTPQSEFFFPYTPNMVFGFSAGKTYLPVADFAATSGTSVKFPYDFPAGTTVYFTAFTNAPISDALTVAGGVMSGPLALATSSTVPTVSQNDTSTQVANMLAIYQGKQVVAGLIDSLQSSLTVTPGMAGQAIALRNETSNVVTLPALSSVVPYTWFEFFNASLNGVAYFSGLVSANGPTLASFDTLDSYLAAKPTTYIINPGESIRFIADLSNGWWRIGPGLTGARGRLLGIKPYLVNGNYTYTRTPGTKSILVIGKGAGGASGGMPDCAAGWVSVAQAGAPGSDVIARYTTGFDNLPIVIGKGGSMMPAVSAGQVGLDGGTTSFGSLLTIPGGKGGAFKSSNLTTGIIADNNTGSIAPSGTGIILSGYGIKADVAFVTITGIYGGIRRNGTGLLGSNNGLGGDGQVNISLLGPKGTASNAGMDGGLIIYEYS